MGNATSNLQPTPVGKDGRKLNILAKGATHLYEGTMIAQSAGGFAQPYSTAGSGPCVGVAQHEQDNSGGADGAHEIQVMWDCEFVFANSGAGPDQVLASTPLGTVLYGSDDHTLALTDGGGTRKATCFFCGLEPDGRVRGFFHPRMVQDADGGGAASDLLHTTIDIPLATIQANASGVAFNVGAALPANARLVRSQINCIAAITGGTLSAVKAKLQGTGTAGELVGGAGGVDVFAGAAVFTDVASGTELDVNRGGQQLQMTLTTTGDTLAHATTGHLSVDLLYVVD